MRFQSALKPGQRLVSREGARWRWDGFTASADAPTAAAQRLAQKNRLAELDSDAVAATLRARAKDAHRLTKAVCGRQARTSGSRGRLGATPNTGSARRAMRWRGLRRQLAEARAAGPRSRKRGVVSRRAMPRPKRRSATAQSATRAVRWTSATCSRGSIPTVWRCCARPGGPAQPTRARGNSLEGGHDGLEAIADRAQKLDLGRGERRPANYFARRAASGRLCESKKRGRCAGRDRCVGRRALLSAAFGSGSTAQTGGGPVAGGGEHAGRAGQGCDQRRRKRSLSSVRAVSGPKSAGRPLMTGARKWRRVFRKLSNTPPHLVICYICTLNPTRPCRI